MNNVPLGELCPPLPSLRCRWKSAHALNPDSCRARSLLSRGGATLEYFDLALSLSLDPWLNKSTVLFVILEGNLRLGLTSVGKVHTVSRLDHPVASDRLRLRSRNSDYSSYQSSLQPERLSRDASIHILFHRNFCFLNLFSYFLS